MPKTIRTKSNIGLINYAKKKWTYQTKYNTIS